MKKTFQLAAQGKHPDRVVDAVKHEIRKYVRRERRRDLPAGVDYWDFACRFGTSADTAEPAHLAAIIGLVDASVQAGSTACYVEIVCRHGIRKKTEPETASGG